MTLLPFTIVLDGMPFITMHYSTLRRLKVDWLWTIVEGVAAPEHCTSWCKKISPRLSEDGTTEYLDSLAKLDPRIRIIRSSWWHGKAAMCNAALNALYLPGILLQLDCDEIWSTDQLETLCRLYEENPKRDCSYHWCRYHVGPEILATSKGLYGNRQNYEWLRSWRFQPGMRFDKHEPPVIRPHCTKPFMHAETERAGLVFEHLAYVTEAQVAFKEQYYGYAGAVEHWKQLQQNRKWPARLRDFLPWVNDNAMAERIAS